MRSHFILFLILYFPFICCTQTVIVDKEIKIGQSANPSQAGAIRFNGTDFEGFDGVEWHSFTESNFASSPIWGQPIISSMEDDKLNAANPSSSDFFGYAVSVSGSTAVIGTYLDDDAGIDAGCAYVFEKSGGLWVETAKLTASDAVNSHWFGYSVAISNDDIVVGAYRDNGDQGAAYVFESPMGGWTSMTETAKITASDGAGGDKFGFSVAINNDEIAIGASEDDDNGVNSGSAYVFKRPMGGWISMTETAKLVSSDGNGSDLFGYSISISDNTILVGAYLQDQIGVDAGAAYIFEKQPGGWVSGDEDAKLTASDGSGGDWFGYSVSISGDDVIVGAYGDNSEKGSAYIFEKPAGNWITTSISSKLDAEDGADDDRFGYSVAISNGIAVVGAPYNDNPNLDQGSAYIFQKNGIGWNHRLGVFTLQTSDGVTDDRAGWSVSISGNSIFSGAFSSTGFDHGAVYVYTRK
jgi:hypothetical protein